MICIIHDRDLSPSVKRFERDSVAKTFLIAVLIVTNEECDRQRGLVGRQPDEFEVRVISGRKEAAGFALAAGRERRLRHFRAKERARKLDSKPPLPDAGRPDEQVCARQTARFDRLAESLCDFVMS
jgi:hypothetical protein